jgi:sulfatase modifying factor 1
MRVCTRFFLIFAVALVATPTRAQLVNYELVTVGDAGNSADMNGTPVPVGNVPYDYRIGKYEVTILQYSTFLNAIATSDTYALYNTTTMEADQTSAGISRTGSSGSFTYSVIGPFGVAPPGADSPGNRPMAFLNWFQSARFANWMSNGQPSGSQGPTTTEDGAYDLINAAPGTAPAVNSLNPNTGTPPLFRLPTENEWYKAAYFKGGGANAGYWGYATQSDVAPGNMIGSAPNQANYFNGLYSVTQSTSVPSAGQNYLTNVGAFTASASAYGAFDMSGNVTEWNDLTGAAGSSRGVRGGDFSDISGASVLSSTHRQVVTPSIEGGYFGFRLAAPAAVPEPSTYAMALAGLACGGYSIFRRRRAG